MRMINPQLIRTSNYKSIVSLQSAGEVNRMNTSPIDYSNFDMVPVGVYQQGDEELFPALPRIDGFVTGIAGVKAVVKIRFDIVLEYIPGPPLKQMVEQKTILTNTLARDDALNLNEMSHPDMSYIAKAGSILESSIDVASEMSSYLLKSGKPAQPPKTLAHSRNLFLSKSNAASATGPAN